MDDYIPFDMFHEIVERAFLGEPRPMTYGSLFRGWFSKLPFDDATKSVAVRAALMRTHKTIDDLVEPHVAEAMRIFHEHGNNGFIRKFLDDHLAPVRLASRRHLSLEACQAMSGKGWGELAAKLFTSSILQIAPVQYEAVNAILAFYGFVHTDGYWEGIAELSPGWPAHKHRYDDLEAMVKLIRPFDDYRLVCEYSRGAEGMGFYMHHHSLEDAKFGYYHTRTLSGNVLLWDGMPVVEKSHLTELGSEGNPFTRVVDPVILMDIMQGRRDALGVAFDHDFVLHWVNEKGVDIFYYDPRMLLENLAGSLATEATSMYFHIVSGLPYAQVEPMDVNYEIAGDSIGALKAKAGILPEDDDMPIRTDRRIPIHYKRGGINVDLRHFRGILEHPNSRRMAGIKSLSHLYDINWFYALQSRQEHCIGVWHVAGVICDNMGIRDRDKLLIQAYALVHDWGHLSGSHATEFYFKAQCGFDHDDFVVQLIKDASDVFDDLLGPGGTDDLIDVVEGRNPLHLIVDGPFGADRLYYTSIDPGMCGVRDDYEPIPLVQYMAWVENQLVVDQHPDLAFEFLSHRAGLYKSLYFDSKTTIADAYLRKLLNTAGIQTPFDMVPIMHKPLYEPGPFQYKEAEFWKLTDPLLRIYLAHHDDIDVREPMRQLIFVYHCTPHVSTAVLKLEGHEHEPGVMVPIYSELQMAYFNPLVETAGSQELASFQKFLFMPEQAARLEQRIADELNIPQRHVICTSTPSMDKLAKEYAPVRLGSQVMSLFDVDPKYAEDFRLRAASMACLRVAVHPSWAATALSYFDKNSLRELVRDVVEG